MSYIHSYWRFDKRSQILRVDSPETDCDKDKAKPKVEGAPQAAPQTVGPAERAASPCWSFIRHTQGTFLHQTPAWLWSSNPFFKDFCESATDYFVWGAWIKKYISSVPVTQTSLSSAVSLQRSQIQNVSSILFWISAQPFLWDVFYYLRQAPLDLWREFRSTGDMLISQLIILPDFPVIFSFSSCHELRRSQMEFLNESICVHCSLQKKC